VLRTSNINNDIRTELENVRVEWLKADNEVKTLLEKREQLIRRNRELKFMLKELREQLKNERGIMDELRKELEQFKNEKNYLWRERAEALHNLRELSRRVFEDEERLKKKLEQLEWYHQTTPLSAKEEDEVIKKIIEIEKKLLIYNKMTQMKQKSTETNEKLNENIKKR
jgi:uncharacterized coiled-coil DUF342 family protein